MQDFIDIFSKLVISIISFIAPLTVYLLGIFGEGIGMVKSQSEEKERQIANLLMSSLNTDQNNTELIDRSNKELKNAKRQSEKTANLLKPKRQINRIFFSLFGSLILIIVAVQFKEVQNNFHGIRVVHVLLTLSVTLFICGMAFIRQVAWVIVDTKKRLDDLKNNNQDNQIKPLHLPVETGNITVQDENNQ